MDSEKPHQHSMSADSVLYVFDARLLARRQRVATLAVSNVKQEVAHHRLPVVGKIYLRMKLNSVDLHSTAPDGWKKFTVYTGITPPTID